MLSLAAQLVRAPDGRGDQQRAGRLVKDGEPDRDARQDREDAEDDLGAERRVDRDRRGPRAFDLATLRAKSTSTATTTQAHQRCMKWSRIEVVGHREERRRATSRSPRARNGRPCRARCWRHSRRESPRPRRRASAGRTACASAIAPQPVNRAGVGASAQVERGPDQRGEQEQREQQMGREAVGADLGAALEARHDHEPADRALKAAKDEQRASRQPKPFGICALRRRTSRPRRRRRGRGSARAAGGPIPRRR